MAELGAGPLTVDDLESLPDEPGTRYELFDGELHVSTQPHHEHQAVCAQVILGLGEWNKRSGLGRVFAAPGIVFSRFDAAAPDVVWASHARLAQIAGTDPPLRGAPELVVEVLSPGAANERRDRETKLQAYAKYGVDEYWVVDRRLNTVEVYRHENGAFQRVAVLAVGDILTSPHLPGFALRVGELFE